MERISGAFAPVPTPLDGAERFDPSALERHLAWLAEAGLDGALILGTNGEFPSLSLGERRTVAEVAASCEGPRHRLLNVGSCALPEVLEMLEVAADLGYCGALCPPPFYFRAAPVSGLASFFQVVLDSARLPLLLYHIPQVSGVPISDVLLDQIGAHERLAGVKDSSGSDNELERLSQRFAHGSYLTGNDTLLQRCLAAAGSGSITAAGSVAPRLVMAASRDAEQQPRLDRLRALLEDFGLAAAVKAVLRHRGFGAYATRPPLCPLAPSQEERLLARFESEGFAEP
jgi:4-hydroxy-tetrahydrodipicolinate synthase